MATAKVLAIGGGGTGSYATGYGAGGGGGGGYQYNAAFTITPQTYAVTVGAGGNSFGANGGNSVFDSITAYGGGVGGRGGNGGGGGCGGGGSTYYVGGSGSQGYKGGDGYSGSNSGGGGGGADAAGTNGYQSYGGHGGAGISNSISGSAVYYSGGGGGGGGTAGGNGTPSTGGGGAGGTGAGTGGTGTDGLGGGGGGGGPTNTSTLARGGSGIVIVRWTTPDFGTCSVTGTGNAITTIGGDSLATMVVSGDLVIASTVKTLSVSDTVTVIESPTVILPYFNIITSSSITVAEDIKFDQIYTTLKFYPDPTPISYWKLDGDSTDSFGTNNGTDTDLTVISGSYASSNRTDDLRISSDTYSRAAQSFTTPNDGVDYTLDSCKFYLARHTNASGDSCYAKIYAHSGTYGSSTTPGTLLATSDARDSSTFTYVGVGSALESFTFSGANRITLSANTYYVISVEYNPASSSNNSVYTAKDNSPSHSGNMMAYTSSWGIYADNDMIFYVYGSSYTAGNGIINQGAGFNGTTGKIVIADDDSLKPTGNFSIASWIKTTATSNHEIFESFSANTSYAGISLIVTSGAVQLLSGKNTGTTVDTDFKLAQTGTVNDGNWHLIVGSWDGTYLNVYIDNAAPYQVAWANAPAYAATNYVRIGCANYTGTDVSFFDGAIDEVGIWNCALSANQVASLYNSGAGRRILTADGIVARVGVDEVIATIKAGAGNYKRDTNSTENSPQIHASATNNQFTDASKVHFGFDTSSLPDVASISAAILGIYINSKNNTLSGESSANSALVLIVSSPESNTSLVNADYENAFDSMTELGRSGTQASLSTAEYNVITLNTAGLSAISRTGITNIGAMQGWMFDETITGLTWGSGGFQYPNIDIAEGTNRPYLQVTYNIPLFSETTTEDVVVSDVPTIIIPTLYISAGEDITVTEDISIYPLSFDLFVFEDITVEEDIQPALVDSYYIRIEPYQIWGLKVIG